MNFDTIKEIAKNKWDRLSKPYQAGICIVLIVLLVFIIA